MTARHVKNAAASVHQRLRNLAKRGPRPFDELLQRYAIERFLYRLSASPHVDRFVLKGALMLAVWDAPMSRPTKDIDLLGQTSNDVEALAAFFRDACLQEVDPDGLAFDPGSVRGAVIKEEADYSGVRVLVDGGLGAARVRIQVDVGFGDVIVPGAEEVVYPTLLDMPAPRLRGYSRESTVAEKLEAAVKLDLRNSRMRDLYDLWFLSRRFQFVGLMLAEAVRRTFENRGTDLDPEPTTFRAEFVENSEKLIQWRSFVERTRTPEAPGDLSTIIEQVSAFLRPVLAALVEGRTFDAHWPPGGPWRERRKVVPAISDTWTGS